MTLPPAVQAEINQLFDGMERDSVEGIVILAVRETARDCIAMCETNARSAPSLHETQAHRLDAAHIRARYEVTK